MKKIAFALAVSALAVLMVLPVIHTVNHFAGKSVAIGQIVVADGHPLPPPIPPPGLCISATTLMADGHPLPPPIPRPGSFMNASTLIADEHPLPPPIPKGLFA